jgi:hypothetical protein
MATQAKAGNARRMPEFSAPNRPTSRNMFVAAVLTTAILGIAGCDKVPTFSELVNGKKKEPAPAPAAPVVQQPRAPVAPKAAPKPAAPPKMKTAQEALAEFTSTPTYRRTDQQLADLAAHPEAVDQITTLELQGSTVSDAGLAALQKFDKVDKLNISRVNYSKEGMASVAKMKNLTCLWMFGGAAKDKNSDDALARVKDMKQLIELRVDASKISPAGIAQIAQMTGLEVLSLNGISQFTDEHLKLLDSLVNLKYLDLSGSYVTDDGLKYLMPFTELETLKMAKMQGVRGRGFKELMMKKGLPKLRDLSVYDNPYLQVEFYEGIARLGRTLEMLDVGAANCNNTVFGGAIPPLQKLVALSVHQNDALSDPGVIQGLAKARRLKSLYFEHNPLVSDASLPTLAKLKSLESLTLTSTACTLGGVNKLKTKLKNCRINFNGKMIE